MKIQVLELPMEHFGEASRTPYALIFSEVPKEHVDELFEEADSLAPEDGKTAEPHHPSWIIVTPEKVEL